MGRTPGSSLPSPEELTILSLQSELDLLRDSRYIVSQEIEMLMEKFADLEKLLSNAVLRHSDTKLQLERARDILADLSICYDEDRDQYFNDGEPWEEVDRS